MLKQNTLKRNLIRIIKVGYEIINGECIEKMKDIPSHSIDLILTDPPYGTTACKWDTVIPLDKMWTELKRIIKPNKAVILFGQEPFSSMLRMSNVEWFKYDWYWRKARPSGFVNAKLKPLKDIEVISVFSQGSTANGSINNMPYNPQGLQDVDIEWSRPKNYDIISEVSPSRKSNKTERKITKNGYPRQVLDYSMHNVGLLHPTQKPVDLLEYLIKTYTNTGDIVLDFTMGSGSTGVACMNTNRNFFGIELSEKFFKIAEERIAEADKPTLF